MLKKLYNGVLLKEYHSPGVSKFHVCNQVVYTYTCTFISYSTADKVTEENQGIKEDDQQDQHTKHDPEKWIDLTNDLFNF